MSVAISQGSCRPGIRGSIAHLAHRTVTSHHALFPTVNTLLPPHVKLAATYLQRLCCRGRHDVNRSLFVSLARSFPRVFLSPNKYHRLTRCFPSLLVPRAHSLLLISLHRTLAAIRDVPEPAHRQEGSNVGK